MSRTIETASKLQPFEAFTNENGADVVDHLAWDLNNKPFGEGSLLPRIGGRYFDLTSGQYKHFDSDNNPEQPLVVLSPTVFRADSPDCTQQAKDVAVELGALQDEGIQVIHVVSQAPDTIRPFVEEHRITHPIISIPRHTVYEMGLGIQPLQTPDGTPLAAVEYWGDGREVTARTATVAGRVQNARQMDRRARIVLSHQRPQDQGAKLNFAKIRSDARTLAR